VVRKVDDTSSFPDEAILKKVLAYGLKKGYWDVVAYSGRDEPVTNGLLNYNVSGWRGRPSIATKPEDIEKAKLKLITPGPTILGVRGAVEELSGTYFHGSDPVRVAILGPPQHIKSIWRGRLSWAGHTKLLKTIVFTVSYFKRRFYLPSKLNLKLSQNGLSLDSATDLKLEKDGIVFIGGDKVLELKYDDLTEAEHPGISSDADITGEYADLSAGILEGIDGIVLIARSDEATKLLDEMFKDGLLERVEVSEEDLVSRLNSLYEVR
jgi:coenzyme F420-reducing hydrogenase beta subunit